MDVLLYYLLGWFFPEKEIDIAVDVDFTKYSMENSHIRPNERGSFEALRRPPVETEECPDRLSGDIELRRSISNDSVGGWVREQPLLNLKHSTDSDDDFDDFQVT